ncbi:MAG: YlmC/YmxH family sporulation protein [Bacillota bacterium]|nr:YlmC/YmxH family sporulation protein [Bacillota bacterium]
MRLSELRQKEVINIPDGKRLGCVCDLDMDICEGKICAIIVPGPSRFFSFFRAERGFVIPWCRIKRIGEDVILVEIDIECNDSR